MVSDWQGDPKRKVIYENGEIVDVVAISKQNIANRNIENERMQGCTIIDYWWCLTGNSYTTCTHEGSTIYCTGSHGVSYPSLDPPTGGSGGGYSVPAIPSGPSGLCDHPFIDGLLVDCDETICGEGFVADENRDCVPDPEPCDDDLIPDGNGDCVAFLSTALTPVNSTDDILNPYDGMQAYDSNGVLYTYNSDLGAWLMPELFTLNNSDDFELEMPTPPTESSIVISLTPIALGEPSVIGEIILAGTTIIVGVVYVYVFEKYLRDAQNTDYCIGMYTICSEEFGYKNMDCSNCRQFFNSQGYWDFERCPLRHTKR